MRHQRDKDNADTNPVDPETHDFDADARRRMHNAVVSLTNSKRDYPIGPERSRLGGKIEGLNLALSYLDEADRMKATASV